MKFASFDGSGHSEIFEYFSWIFFSLSFFSLAIVNFYDLFALSTPIFSRSSTSTTRSFVVLKNELIRFYLNLSSSTLFRLWSQGGYSIFGIGFMHFWRKAGIVMIF